MVGDTTDSKKSHAAATTAALGLLGLGQARRVGGWADG